MRMVTLGSAIDQSSFRMDEREALVARDTEIGVATLDLIADEFFTLFAAPSAMRVLADNETRRKVAALEQDGGSAGELDLMVHGVVLDKGDDELRDDAAVGALAICDGHSVDLK